MAKKRPLEPGRNVPNTVRSGTTKRASDRTARPGEPDYSKLDDRHAVGTAGGGTEVGGLAGTNLGHGDPEDANLEEVTANGLNEPEADDENAYGGSSGGAVGGTPAGRRSSGGRIRRGLAPGSTNRRGDSTIGSDPEQPSD